MRNVDAKGWMSRSCANEQGFAAFVPMHSRSLLYSNSSNLAAGEPISRMSLFHPLAEEELQSEGEFPAVARALEPGVKVTMTKRQRTRLRAETAKKTRHMK